MPPGLSQVGLVEEYLASLVAQSSNGALHLRVGHVLAVAQHRHHLINRGHSRDRDADSIAQHETTRHAAIQTIEVISDSR